MAKRLYRIHYNASQDFDRRTDSIESSSVKRKTLVWLNASATYNADLSIITYKKNFVEIVSISEQKFCEIDFLSNNDLKI